MGCDYCWPGNCIGRNCPDRRRRLEESENVAAPPVYLAPNVTERLLERLRAQLPQRTIEGVKVDQYRFALSAEEREHLTNILAKMVF